MEDVPAPEPGTSTAVNGGKTIPECEDMIRRSLRSIIPSPFFHFFSAFGRTKNTCRERDLPCRVFVGFQEPSQFSFFLSFFFMFKSRLIVELMLDTAPMVKFLLENLEKSGCAIGDKFIRAVHCNRRLAGGYVRGEGVRLSLSLSLSRLFSFTYSIG